MAGSGKAHLRPEGSALIRVEDLVVQYKSRGSAPVQAVSNVSLDVLEGETLSIVGESGCGKSTLGKALLQLVPATGSIKFQGQETLGLKREQVRQLRPQMQMIFQDPISSLDPRFPISKVVEEPLETWNRGSAEERSRKVDELLNAVGLDPAIVRDRKPYEFSGGQCQRISIARALALEPKLMICDEPVSALDVSIQAQILNILQDMKDRYGLTLIFISHDLAVVRAVSTRIMVMYLGKVCEVGTPQNIYAKPRHHYTEALLSAVPIPDPTVKRNRKPLEGDLPSPSNPPSGCRFRTRCAAATDKCAAEEPQLAEVAPGHFAACHHPVAQ